MNSFISLGFGSEGMSPFLGLYFIADTESGEVPFSVLVNAGLFLMVRM